MEVKENEAIVLPGGGGAGQAYLGLIKYYEETQTTPKHICGVSVGSIFGLLIALQFTFKESLQLINEQPDFTDARPSRKLKNYQDSMIMYFVGLFPVCRIPWIGWLIKKFIFKLLTYSKTFRKVFSLRNFGGLYQGKDFTNWLREKISEKFENNPDPTFKDILDHYGVFLNICAVDIDERDKEYLCLNPKTVPDMSVVDAVRMSISLPFFFEHPLWGQELYTGRSKLDHRIVDGGVMSNAPIWVWLDDHPHIIGPLPENLKVTCFYLDDNKTVRGLTELNGDEPETWFEKVMKKSHIFELFENVYVSCLSSDNIVIYRYAELVCRLPRHGYSTLQFEIPPKKRELLVNAAYKEVKDFYS